MGWGNFLDFFCRTFNNWVRCSSDVSLWDVTLFKWAHVTFPEEHAKFWKENVLLTDLMGTTWAFQNKGFEHFNFGVTCLSSTQRFKILSATLKKNSEKSFLRDKQRNTPQVTFERHWWWIITAQNILRNTWRFIVLYVSNYSRYCHVKKVSYDTCCSLKKKKSLSQRWNLTFHANRGLGGQSLWDNLTISNCRHSHFNKKGFTLVK